MADESGKNLDDLTVAELRERASALEITGRSSMNKEELVQAVEDAEAQTAMMKSEDATASSGADADTEHDSDSESSDTTADTPVEDRPWREDRSSGDDDENAAGITAPSIGPHTKLEHVPPEERLDMEKISDVDAMGLDKRRQVQGKRYGASPAKQAAVYGGALAVIAGLLIAGKILTDELDKAPPEGEVPPAPWADAEQRKPAPIDFPCAITGSNDEVQCGPDDDASP